LQNQLANVFKEKRGRGKRKIAHIGTNVRAHIFDVGLLARSQFASGRSCDRTIRSRLSVIFLGSRESAELVPKFNVALHASHAVIQMVILTISP
jgi:hypothetical protein